LAKSGLAGAGAAAVLAMAETVIPADKVADSRKETIDFMVVIQELEEGGKNHKILQ
jgi:hypothetical protein